MQYENTLLHTVFGFPILGAVAPATTPIESESPSKPKDNLPLISLPEEAKEAAGSIVNRKESTVTITVVGASGDLAKKKIFPALFALYYEDCLPQVLTYLSWFITR